MTRAFNCFYHAGASHFRAGRPRLCHTISPFPSSSLPRPRCYQLSRPGRARRRRRMGSTAAGRAHQLIRHWTVKEVALSPTGPIHSGDRDGGRCSWRRRTRTTPPRPPPTPPASSATPAGAAPVSPLFPPCPHPPAASLWPRTRPVSMARSLLRPQWQRRSINYATSSLPGSPCPHSPSRPYVPSYLPQ